MQLTDPHYDLSTDDSELPPCAYSTFKRLWQSTPEKDIIISYDINICEINKCHTEGKVVSINKILHKT